MDRGKSVMILLKTSHLIIRDARQEDIDGWHRLLSDPKTMCFLQGILMHSLEESSRYLEIAIVEAESSSRTKYFFSIEHGETGAFLGIVGYTVTHSTPIGSFAEIGYFILPEYHEMGYALEAMQEVICFAFRNGNVYQLSASCLSDDLVDGRTMKKCGMIKEAKSVSSTWHDGYMKERIEYRLLRDDWEFVFFPSETPESLQFVVIAAQHNGKWVCVQHKKRDTYEMPGGHIEPDETPFDAAKRELYEESGAIEFSLFPVSYYGVEIDGKITYGELYFANIAHFGELPDFEIKGWKLFQNLPERLTFPHIQPILMERTQRWLKKEQTTTFGKFLIRS